MKMGKVSRRAGWLAFVVTIAVATALCVALLGRRSPTRELMRSAESAPWRPIKGRLSGFAHVPPPRAGASKNDSDLLALRAIAASILAGPRDEPQTAGVASLLYGKSGEAVTALEALVARDANNAGVWSNLAAARLEEGATSDDPRMTALALTAADRALALQPTYAEAVFNRALALDALGLRFASAAAWRRYLELDSASAWAVEARDRLTAAEVPTREEAWKNTRPDLENAVDLGGVAAVERIVRGFPLQARTLVEVEYLPGWGEAFMRGDAGRAKRLLTRASLIAAALQNANGDALLHAAIGAVETEGVDKRALARAFVTYGEGREHNAARRITESLAAFTKAEREFGAAGNPMELSAAYFRANALVDLGDKQQAEALAASLEQRSEEPARSFRSLHAHILWLRARLSNDAGHPYETLLIARRARETFESLGEVDYAARLQTGEAAMLARLGRDREAWQSRRAALTAAAESGRWTLVETAIDAISRESVETSDGDIARSLLDVQIAVPLSLPLMRFNGTLWRSFIDARAKGTSLDIYAARRAAALIPDAQQRADSLDELRLAEGLILARFDPEAADALFSEVIVYRERRLLLSYLPSIHLQRARVRRRIARKREAQQDLRDAIELIESRRGAIRNDTLRDAFLGNFAEAYGELADLLLEQGEWQKAFEVAEQARARLLLDHAERRVMTIGEITSTIPTGVIAAHYTTFASRTLLTILRRGTASHEIVPIGRAELESIRDQLALAMDHDTATSAHLSRRLHDLLIAPLASHLRDKHLLVIVPDDASYGIPFAALRTPSGKFLVEESAIAIAPCAAAIGNDMTGIVPLESKVTVVADPAFSATLFPKLDRLPEARRDADVIGSMFVRRETLTGNRATKSALLEAARDSDALHIAAHALVSPRDASLSLIALAPSETNDGVLYLEDVESMELRRRPLVVLAGCETASLGGGRGSIRSLAWAFLAAGGRSVLATLWDVEDERASVFTNIFYKTLATGASLPDALREAQLTAMRTHPPREWAAFQLHVAVPSAVGKIAHRDTLTMKGTHIGVGAGERAKRQP